MKDKEIEIALRELSELNLKDLSKETLNLAKGILKSIQNGEAIFSPVLLCDFYKILHKDQYPLNTELIYSTLTPRSNKYFEKADKVVVFGIQAFVKKYLIDYFNKYFFARPKEVVLHEYNRILKHTMGIEHPDSTHIAALHDLGYLPIELKALKEGTLVDLKTPVLTIENTKPDFFWLTNALETLLSAETWQAMTSATIAREYRLIMDEFAYETVGSNEAVAFQGHDFSFRGMSNADAAAISSAAHLLFHRGTDTIPAIQLLEKLYNANVETELVGSSIPATEHSVMCAGTDADSRDEYEMFKRLITEIYPSGLVSIVSDSYDFWDVIGRVIPMLKDEIMQRDGKVVIRPDSGDPVKILTGTIDVHEYETHKAAKLDLGFKSKLQAEANCGYKRWGQEEFEYVYKVGMDYFKLKLSAVYNESLNGTYYLNGFNESQSEYKVTLEEIGLIEALWNIFGGTETEKGYKLLDSHIGAIYGDSITLERANEILSRLEKRGFASINVVLGIGSFTYQYNTRDTLGFAIKATYAQIDGEEKLLFKDPKTDDGTKRSQRGRVVVYEENGEIKFKDGFNIKSQIEFIAEKGDLLETVFKDGKLIRDESLSEIRARIESQESLV